MKKLLLPLLALALTLAPARADEGMWVLPYLSQNAPAMKKAGLKITPEQIYSINNSSLKDAIVIFGGGCTGEIVSPDGLLFTNHHCGFGAIQKLSTMEHNYLRDGFWAKNRQGELPAEGLKVKFVKEMRDVTEQMLAGVKPTDSEHLRDSLVQKNIDAMSKRLTDSTACLEAMVKPIYEGNQYILYVYEVFGDVRLVGTPSQAIGKFGGDTDNWMWPRHTGDFSIFRVYASPDNKPTKELAADNVPLKAKKHLAISTKGVKEGDFTMIMGFPGRTSRYLTAKEIQNTQLMTVDRINIRTEKQKIWDEDMQAVEEIKLKYANKFAGSSNGWKKWTGMRKDIGRLNMVENQSKVDSQLEKWIAADPERQKKYGEVLTQINKAADLGHYATIQSKIQLIKEILGGAEAHKLAAGLIKDYSKLTTKRDSMIKAINRFYLDYNPETDKKTTFRMLQFFSELYPGGSDYANLDVARNYARNFDRSIFTDRERLLASLDDSVKLANDPIGCMAVLFNRLQDENQKALKPLEEEYDKARRLYLAALIEKNGGRPMYPDANFTIRLTYGKVASYKPAEAVYYSYKTTLDGMMAKVDFNNPDFVGDDGLSALYRAKDYGRWAENGTIPNCFLTDNDITGGNSGSPVLNDKGELIGLAFDGNWESMTSDLAFDTKVQRCINVDVRYLLFVIEKLGKAGYLLDELTLR